MNVLIVFVLCVLATTKVTLQGRLAKRHLETRSDATVFNAAVFLSAAILFSPGLPSASLATWGCAAVFAVFTVLFQLTYTSALALGNVSLTVMIVNLGMLFPVLTSVWVYREPLTPVRLCGIALTLFSFVLCTEVRGERRLSRGWLFLTLVATVANGALGVTQKVFGASPNADERAAFVASAYTVAFLVMLALCFVLGKRGGTIVAHKKKETYLFAIAVGIILALFQWLNTYAISTMDGAFLFPLYSGGSILLSTLVGVTLFRDRLTARQRVSLFVGIVAVILMNF